MGLAKERPEAALCAECAAVLGGKMRYRSRLDAPGHPDPARRRLSAARATTVQRKNRLRFVTDGRGQLEPGGAAGDREGGPA